jgi:NADH-quinone oxidoreductase subunit M
LLWLYQRVFFGDPAEEVSAHVTDLDGRELAAIVPLILMMVWMGVYARGFLSRISPSTAKIVEPIELRVEIPHTRTMADAR